MERLDGIIENYEAAINLQEQKRREEVAAKQRAEEEFLDAAASTFKTIIIPVLEKFSEKLNGSGYKCVVEINEDFLSAKLYLTNNKEHKGSLSPNFERYIEFSTFSYEKVIRLKTRDSFTDEPKSASLHLSMVNSMKIEDILFKFLTIIFKAPTNA